MPLISSHLTNPAFSNKKGYCLTKKTKNKKTPPTIFVSTKLRLLTTALYSFRMWKMAKLKPLKYRVKGNACYTTLSYDINSSPEWMTKDT